MKPSRPSIPGLVAVLWLAAVVGLYFVSHKPFSPDLAVNLARAGGQIAVALAIISLGGGLGVRLLPWLGLQRLARLALQAAFGLGLLSVGMLVLGSTVGTPLWLGWGILLGGGLLLRREMARWWRGWRALQTIWQAGSRLERAIGYGIALILLLTLSTALAPPVKFDSLVYHFALPKAYIEAGRMTYLPWIMYWGLPQLGEALYTWAMLLGGGQAAAVLGWAFGALALAGLLGYAVQRLGMRAGWIAVAALLSGFSPAASLAWGYVDWLTLLYGLGVLATLDLWQHTRTHRELLLAGACAGFALSIKYTAGTLLLAGLFAIFWYGTRHRALHIARKTKTSAASPKTGNTRLAPSSQKTPPTPRAPRLRGKNKTLLANLLIFGSAATLTALPWLLKNALATGNPFYPFILPSGAMDAFRLAVYQNQPPWGNWLDFALLPLRASLIGQEGAPGYGASIGPLLLSFGALGWLGWRARPPQQRAALTNAALIALPGLLIWALAGRVSGLLIQTRLYFTLLPAFALLAGAGFTALQNLSWPGVRLGRVAGIIVLLVFGLNLVQVSRATFKQGAPQTLLGLHSEETYLTDNLGMYALTMQALGELPAGSRTLLLWEPRSYACLPHCAPDEVLDRWFTDYYRHGSADAVLQSWQEADFTHLLFHNLGADFFRPDPRFDDPEAWAQLDEFLAQLPVQTEFNDLYTLYRLP